MQATQKTDIARTLSAETIDFLSFSVIFNHPYSPVLAVLLNYLEKILISSCPLVHVLRLKGFKLGGVGNDFSCLSDIFNRTAQIHPNLLQYMVPDLEEKYNFVGMDISEVDKLLDLKNWGPSNYGREYYHRIGGAYKFLVISYDKNGKVTKFYTTDDIGVG